MKNHFLEKSLIQLQKLGSSPEPMAICYDPGNQGFRVYLDLESPVILNRGQSHEQLDNLFRVPSQEIQSSRNSRLSWQGNIGFMGYEFLAANMGIHCRAPQDLPIVDGIFARPQTLIRIKPQEIEIESELPERKKHFTDLFKEQDTPLPTKSISENRVISCNLDFKTYSVAFDKAMQAIQRGETYQIKLSQRYHASCDNPPLSLFIQLMCINPSPESFLFQWDDFSLVSCSPETLLIRKGEKLITRPIGGTCQRESHPEEINAFLEDPKERAEHNMLVDLLRNDLSRVCQQGSVVIDCYRKLETYSHLHHLVTTISGTMKQNIQGRDIIASIFPGGSIVGCPKYRTMELIDVFEPCFRGPYTGSFGTISDTGDFHFNIIIRSILKIKSQVYIQTASGIVANSNPRHEYEENHLKAEALLQLIS